MDYKLVLDVIVAVLLAATIAYAIMLNRRLGELRRNRDDLSRLVQVFNDATARAEAGIPKLRRAAEEAGSTLQERVEKAQSLRDDLAFMIERADAMANRLEGVVRSARDVKTPNAAPAGPAPSRPSMSRAQPIPEERSPSGRPQPGPHFSALNLDDEIEDERSEAERELLRALQSAR
jgi:hypothetical protein